MSAVFAVQVKVEEVEMEMPIEPPNSPQQVCLGRIKQEEGEEQNKSELHKESEQTSTGNVSLNKTGESKGRGEERRSLEESFGGESSMAQSEDDGAERDQEEESRVNDSVMDGLSESNTKHNTTGEAGMEG